MQTGGSMATAEPGDGALSLSSRVSNGWVGNTLVEEAVRGLAPGLRLQTIDTVQWTGPGNHPRRTGPVLSAENLREMLAAMLEPGGDSFGIGHVLTGYLRTADQVRAVAEAIARHRGQLHRVIVDPVMGDNGRLYIAGETARAIGGELAPLADYLLPNQTEAAFLCGLPDGADAEAAGKKLLEKYPNLKGVAVTSSPKRTDPTQIGSHILLRGGGGHWTGGRLHDGLFHGTGDFFAGAVLALMAREENPEDFPAACDKASILTHKAIRLMQAEPTLTGREAYRRAMA